jgi:hypothetical protein
VRRYYCDRERVAEFLVRYKPLFARDRRVIWNTDEAQLNSVKRFRVLCQRGLLPLAAADIIPHLSPIVSISGGADVLKPIVILKNLQNVGNLSDLEAHCFFATSQNGWITNNL